MSRQKTLDNKGFTLVEMLVVITIIGILASIAVPNYMKAKNKAKEAECKSNMHVIQAALERYATDHDGNYPPYLIGGDKAAWDYWHSRNDRAFPNASFLQDPLIAFGYIDGYPKNPFVNDGSVVITTTGGLQGQAGTGDPRFGMGGDVIANVVDDPRYYRQDNPNDPRDPVIETYLSLPLTVPAGFFPDRYHYMMGGFPDSNGTYHKAAWIGDFFYRAIKEVKLGRTGAQTGVVKLPDYGWSGTNDYYMLGTFGAEETRGMDVVRLVNTDSNNNQLSYRTPPESGLNIPIGIDGVNGNGLPELFGGGDREHGPVWPYNYDIDKTGIEEVRFGAPDGFIDGVIMVLTSTGNNQEF